VTVALGLAVSLVPGLEQRAELGAERFVDRAAYSAQVLHGVASRTPSPAVTLTTPTGSSVAYGLAGLAIALAVAAFGLWHGELPGTVRRRARGVLGPPIELMRNAHSGIVGDYLLWLAGATIAIATVCAIEL
jgi:hypothetical protein